MAQLLVLKHQLKETLDSPEYLFLQSCNFLQSRKVFKSITKHFWTPGAPLPSLDNYHYVLVLGPENTFFSEKTLLRMKAALDRGASISLPSPFAEFPLSMSTRAYTRRRFEQAEEQVYLQKQKPRAYPTSHLPVGLFDASVFRDIAARSGADAIFTRRDLLDDLPADVTINCDGIYHEVIDYYGVVRNDILQFIPEGVKEVLEVGCARGYTGRVIEDRFGCRVTGVDINPSVTEEAAQNLSAVIVGDIMTTPISGRFDAIVATELFEHLNYPEQFLEKMKGLLKPGGRIVLSVPNVGHFSIVEDLIAGHWDYLPIGLLCYTHFRFFTRRTLDDWINRVGFSSYQIIAQESALPDQFRKLTELFEVDLESLKAKAFYVILEK